VETLVPCKKVVLRTKNPHEILRSSMNASMLCERNSSLGSL